MPKTYLQITNKTEKILKVPNTRFVAKLGKQTPFPK